MARRLTKIVIISILVLIVLTGIVVGVLFATGVLGKKPGSHSSSPVPPGPGPSPPTPPGPFNPVLNCDQMPSVSSFNRQQSDGSYILTFSPIAENCVQSKTWYYAIQGTGLPMGYTSSILVQFNPSAGQSSINIPKDSLPTDDPHSPVKAVTGLIWLRSVNANGTGDLQQSNQLPFTFTDL